MEGKERAAAVTVDQVMNAADEVVAAGKTPTYAAVREHLGMRGSITTISKGMKAWQARSAQEESDAVPEAPEAVQSAFGRLWAETWKEASRSAGLAFDAAKSTLQEETRSAVEAAEQAAGLARQMENQLADAEARNATLSTELEAALQAHAGDKAALHKAELALATAAERAGQLEKRLALAEEQLLAANEMNRTLAQVVKSHEKATAKEGGSDGQ